MILPPHGAGAFSGPQQGATGAPANTTQLIWRPQLQFLGGTQLLGDGTIYAQYLGTVPVLKNFRFVEFVLQLVGVGAQAAEVALGSSPLAPNKAGQNITCLVVDNALDSLTAGAGTMKRNTVAFNGGLGFDVAAGTELWAMIRTSMAGTEPTIPACGFDQAQGYALMLAGQPAITATTVYAMGLIGSLTGAAGPYISATQV